MKWFACAIALACGARTEIGGVIAATSDAGDAPSDATCVDEDIAFDADGATVLAVDGDTVFWGSVAGVVQRHDASGSVTLADTAQTLSAMTLDATNVYVTTSNGALLSIPRAGGAPKTIATSLGLPFALTIHDDTFYYVNYGAGVLAGSVVALGPVESPTTSTTILDDLDTPGGLAVDDANIYVSAQMFAFNGQTVMAAIVSAKRDVPSANQSPVVLATANETRGVAIDDSRVYYIDQVDAHFEEHGGLFAVAKTGGASSKLVAADGSSPLDVFVDASGAYVNTLSIDANHANTTRLLRGALDGSGATTLATLGNGDQIVQVRTNATAIFYSIAWPANLPTPENTPENTPSLRKKCK